VITGDLTDDIMNNSIGRIFQPVEDDWKLYREVMTRADVDKSAIVEVLGNHDIWGRLYFSEQYNKYLLHPIVTWTSQTTEIKDVRIVSFVPSTFPAPGGFYQYFGRITPDILDSLESQLEENTTASVTFVASHFTSQSMFSIDSTKSRKSGRTFPQILNDPRYRVAAFLNGHEHPPSDFEVVHTGRVIELTGMAMKVADGFNLFTLDNGRISYTRIVPNHPKNAIVTSPGRNSLATRIFPDETFEIRVLSFSENATQFLVSGAVTGNLTFRRTTAAGNALYALKVTLPRGRHTIRFSGDIDDEIEFSVGLKVPPFDEYQTIDFKLDRYPRFARYGFLYAALALVALVYLPWPIEASFEGGLAYMNGESDRAPILPNFLCPLYVGWLLRRLPAFARKGIVLMVALPLVLPFGISTVESCFCFQFIWGYFCNGTFQTDPASARFAHLYYNGIVAGFLALFALFAFDRRPGRLIDGVFAVFIIGMAVFYWERFGGGSAGRSLIVRISPGFHLVPSLMTCIFVFLFFTRSRMKQNTYPFSQFISLRNSDGFN
jgi:hypothetical protein